VDLPHAFSIALQSGLIENGADFPSRVLDVIAGGEQQRRICETILREARTGRLAAACLPVASVSLMAPIPRPAKNVFCVGSNYRAHVTEASRAQKKQDEAPKLPVFFTKPPTAVIGPGETIRLDPAVSEKMDYEVELGVVIGKAGRDIAAVDAIQHIFGFTIINDVTARDLQRRHGGQFLKGKGLDTSCPMGPQIVTLDELPNFENLRISLTVNGDLRQDGNTGSLIFPIARLLESLSEGMTLEPGDILATGTPSGVGYAMDPPIYLKDGDTITCEIERIGQLTNTVCNVSSAASAT
jgi:2-keto-4-pentenoate hydratase/2-oxohepta-3-ene-1,7-dioic acid hydratase in catechol pathway